MLHIFNRKTSRELVDDLTYLNNLTDSMTVSNEMLDINIDNELERSEMLETLHDEYLEMLDTYKRTKKIFKKQQKQLAKLQNRNAKLLGQINSINNKMH